MKNTLVRRKQLQTALSPVIHEALGSIEQLDLNREEDARRLMRALVRIGASELLAHGHAPSLLAEACIEGLAREVEATTAVVSTSLATTTQGVTHVLPEPAFPV